jgi:hypothetical protein
MLCLRYNWPERDGTPFEFLNARSRSPYKLKATVQIQVIKYRAFQRTLIGTVDPRLVMARARFKSVVATASCQRDQCGPI